MPIPPWNALLQQKVLLFQCPKPNQCQALIAARGSKCASNLHTHRATALYCCALCGRLAHWREMGAVKTPVKRCCWRTKCVWRFVGGEGGSWGKATKEHEEERVKCDRKTRSRKKERGKQRWENMLGQRWESEGGNRKEKKPKEGKKWRTDWRKRRRCYS